MGSNFVLFGRLISKIMRNRESEWQQQLFIFHHSSIFSFVAGNADTKFYFYYELYGNDKDFLCLKISLNTSQKLHAESFATFPPSLILSNVHGLL
jgi:hypothetical protein